MNILTKDQMKNNIPGIKMQIISILYKNQYILQTKYNIVTNIYLISKLYQVLAELIDLL